MMSPGINLVMTVIGFAVSTMFIVFVCTRLICARIHLAASSSSSSSRRRSFTVSSRSDLSSLERGLHGVEPLVIANFPTKKYSDAFFSSTEDAQCTVCLGDYHGEDTLRILPFCAHFFHATCIDIWLKQHSTCPVCRISLRELPEKKRVMQPMFSSAVRLQHGTTDSAHQNPHDCSLPGHGFPTIYCDNHRVGLVHEDQRRSQDDEASESNSFPDEHSPIRKDSENKHMESLSNPHV